MLVSVPIPSRAQLPRLLFLVALLGCYLTVRGYHSRDGDQAYRLPLLLHRQSPALYANDPFVRAFDRFNPHRGYLALLDLASRPLGLSAALFGLFTLTFLATCLGVDRLAGAAWPERGSRVGLVAVALLLSAKAGNIGTNHLFEAMLLDRLIGFGLGWLALAAVVERPERGCWLSAPLVGLAALIHPSVGLQVGMLLAVGWVAAACIPNRSGIDARLAGRAVLALGLALLPGVMWNIGQGGKLLEGLPRDEFRLLSVELQGPQHMLPHLWRRPQWLAWGCYPVLALVSLVGGGGVASWPRARVRLALLLTLNLIGLGLGWVAVEVARDLRITLFQPFRMATILRGLALVAISGRVLELWRRGTGFDRARAALLTVGLAGDWSFVVATAFELACALSGRRAVGLAVLGAGLAFLARHDTESGQQPLIAALVVIGVGTMLARGRVVAWNRRRVAWAFLACWAIPSAAFLAGLAGEARPHWTDALVARCRFSDTPLDDIERLAVWCRAHTPEEARFIGPPGPKTFRLWALRSLAFNRAASPYDATSLADWADRFRAHVGFEGPTESFIRAYQADRHGLESRFQAMGSEAQAALALRQGATFVVTAAPGAGEAAARGPLELVHVEGRYAVYQVRATASAPAVAGR